MQVKQMIDEAGRLAAPGAPPGTRHRREARVAAVPGEAEGAVAMPLGARGRHRARWLCGGLRLQRHQRRRLTGAQPARPPAAPTDPANPRPRARSQPW